MSKKENITSSEFATSESGAFEYYVKSVFIIQSTWIQIFLNWLINRIFKKQSPRFISLISKLLLGGLYILIGFIIFFLQPWNRNF
jgi:hypothetical protein